MIRLLRWASEKAYALFKRHDDQVKIAAANAARMCLGFAAGHVCGLAFLGHLSPWLVDSGAAVLVNLVGVAWGEWIRRGRLGVATAAVRVAVAQERAGGAQPTEAQIAAVPDSVHASALAQVKELNRNGGVPPPA